MANRLIGGVALAGLALTVAACGGGGVDSTPPPTPTPTPTPPPTTANTDLIGPLVSETFKNDQARGSANFNANGSTSGTAAQTTGSIAYSAANQSYTITTNGGTITFLPSNIDAAQSSAGATVYIKTSGNVSDSLTVTRPGTSGRITYKHVGGAFWQHTVQNPTTASVSIDAIAYGVQTPASAVPTTGQANFDVDLVGAESLPAAVAPLGGTGTATIDFATGAVIIVGTLSPPSLPGANASSWSAAAKMASAGSFSGTFTFEDFGTFKGSLAGHLYGPQADEIGASFSAAQSDGRIAVGTITGRRAAADPGNAAFNAAGKPLSNSQTFTTQASRINFNLQGASGQNNANEAFSATSGASESVLIRYDAATNTYSLAAPDLAQTLTLGQNVTTSGSPYGYANFTAYVPQSGNTDYVRIGSWRNEQGKANGSTDYRHEWLAFGMESPLADIPKSGSAGYKVWLTGTIADSDRVNISTLGGTGGFWVDFATGQIRAKIPIVVGEDYIMAGRAAKTALGYFNMAGTVSASANVFAGTASFDGIGAYNGTVSGKFFGPGAGEVGGTFLLNDGGSGVASGAFAGAKDAAVTDPAATIAKLAQLSGPTDLNLMQQPTPFTDTKEQLTKVTYDPTTQTYTVVTGAVYPHSSGPVTYGSATRDANQALAGYDSHTATLGGETVHAILVRPDNAKVQLSYLSFGEFSRERGIYGDYRLFAIYGNAMPLSEAPRSGTASYTGVVLASASVGDYVITNGPDFGSYRLLGDALLSVNWGSQTFNADFTNLVGTRYSDGHSLAFSPINYIGALGSNGFFTGGNSSHYLNGQFYGTNAAEFGATFFDRPSLPGTALIEVTGVAAGKKN